MIRRIIKKGYRAGLLFAGVMVLAISLFGMCEVALGWRLGRTAEEKAKAAEEKARTTEEKAKIAKEKARMVAIERKRKLVIAAKTRLNNTVWQIELTQIKVESKKKENFEDTLRFIDNKVESEKLVEEGYPRTNFSVRIKKSKTGGEDIVIWETMQTHEEGGIAFWRGDLHGDAMRGVLSWHIDEEKKKDYNFVSVEEETALPEEAEEEPAVKEEKVEEKAAAKTEEAKKTKPEPKKTKRQKERKRWRFW